ncbi:MAG TPA: WYL domain-containing protein [Chitinophagaceae bacterium]|nr:WYL domain-containing protein [Chitinophagaceae bacterium]
MKNKYAVTRYRLIDNRMTMKQKPAPSLQEIVDYVSEKLGTTVSVSSIQKDIYAMRNDEGLGFFAPIEYDSFKKGYVYKDPNYSVNNIPVSEEDLQGLEIAIGILEQFKELPAIKLFEDAINKIASSVKQSRENKINSNILLLDRPKRYKGIEHLSEIVDAIRQKHEMRIQYQPFNKTEAKKHRVQPYFIKEYNGRMYLIAKDIHPTKKPIFLTFAFDRMSDVLKMNQTFNEDEMDRENYFNATIGISLTGEKPEKISLQFEPTQANYVKSQPVHHSQRIVKDTKNQLVIELEVVVNYELIAMLLSFGEKVKVLKPLSLAQKITNIAQAVLSKYDS